MASSCSASPWEADRSDWCGGELGHRYPSLTVNVFLLRIIVWVLLLAALAVGAVPLLVMFDLAAGGTGFGLCPEGIRQCDTGFATPVELTVILILLLFALVAAIRFVSRLARRLDA